MAQSDRPGAGAKGAGRTELDDPSLYINRELSWLEFNDRVLREGLNDRLPLLERLKFLAIVSSNLDEYFMVRVAGLKHQKEASPRKKDPSGLTASEQLKRVGDRVRKMVAEQSEGIRQALGALAAHDVKLLTAGELSDDQKRYVQSYFAAEVEPTLTPLAVDRLHPTPVLPDLQLMLAVRMQEAQAKGERIVVVPVTWALPRYVNVPIGQGVGLIRLEEVIAANIGRVLPDKPVKAMALFRLTRDADVTIDDDAGDLLDSIEQAVSARHRRSAVRLELSAGCDAKIRYWLMDWTALSGQDVYEIDGLMDARALWEIVGRSGLDKLRAEDWPPQTPAELAGEDDLWTLLQERDVLLSHPYETFEPVVRLVEQAAADPAVLAIKMTLYRTSGDSPIVAALERAAKAGKQVIALVELKARFDEARNVVWARRLEDAGAFVIYGIAGYKTHSKAMLIVRRESQRIRRYVHLATGNYNDKTARLYSDVGLMTSDNDIAADVSAFFNLLTGDSEQVGWSRLAIAPGGLRSRFEELIEREAALAAEATGGLILAKVNSLQDRGMIQALYRASRAGVRVRLNVRGMCCLRPGVAGVSENIEVVSIVDRFLEHARIFYFRNAGREEVYLGSADWMTRNLDKRLEILFPVLRPELRERLLGVLQTYFADNVKARRLRADGTYEPVPAEGKPVRAQEALYREAVEAAKAGAAKVRFRPLTRPKE
jgi:polyphosphate kinase